MIVSRVVFVPAFFLLVYGYALNFDLRHIQLAVQDNDRSSASRELVSAFVNSGYFDFAAEVFNGEDILGAHREELAHLVPRQPAPLPAVPLRNERLQQARRARRVSRLAGWRLVPCPTSSCVTSYRESRSSRSSSPSGAVFSLET